MSDQEQQPDWQRFVDTVFEGSSALGLSLKDLAAEYASRPLVYVQSWRPPALTWTKPLWRWQLARTLSALREVEDSALSDTHPLVITAETLISDWEFGWTRLSPQQRQHVRKQTILRNADPGIITRAFRGRHVRVIRGQIAFKRMGSEARLTLELACAALSSLALWILLFTVQSVTKTECIGCDAIVMMQLSGLCAALAWVCLREGPRRISIEQHLQMLGVTGV